MLDSTAVAYTHSSMMNRWYGIRYLIKCVESQMSLFTRSDQFDSIDNSEKSQSQTTRTEHLHIRLPLLLISEWNCVTPLARVLRMCVCISLSVTMNIARHQTYRRCCHLSWLKTTVKEKFMWFATFKLNQKVLETIRLHHRFPFHLCLDINFLFAQRQPHSTNLRNAIRNRMLDVRQYFVRMDFHVLDAGKQKDVCAWGKGQNIRRLYCVWPYNALHAKFIHFSGSSAW